MHKACLQPIAAQPAGGAPGQDSATSWCNPTCPPCTAVALIVALPVTLLGIIQSSRFSFHKGHAAH